jgi:hypothetical protein
VDRLQRVLEEAGITVWRDTANLWAGQDWKIEVRRAITTGSLAFIACFSENSELKRTSYQREELILATEQMRLRPPGRPWLIPVRFADCGLPDFDLGPGRTLDSLHRIDLFDGSWADATPRLVGAVFRVLDGAAPTAGRQPDGPSAAWDGAGAPAFRGAAMAHGDLPRAPPRQAQRAAGPPPGKVRDAPARQGRRAGSGRARYFVAGVLVIGGLTGYLLLRGHAPAGRPASTTSSPGSTASRSSASTAGSSPAPNGASPPQGAGPIVSGLPRTLLSHNGGGAVSVAFPGGQTLAAALIFGSTLRWRLPALHSPASLFDAGASTPGREVVIYGAAFSPNGKTVAAGSSGGIVYLLNLSTGKTTTLSDPVPGSTIEPPPGGMVEAVAFSSSNQALAVGLSDGDIYVWNLSTDKRTMEFRDPRGGILNLAFSSDGQTLAEDTGAEGSSFPGDGLYLWSLLTQQHATLPYPGADPEGAFGDVAFSPNGKALAASDTDGNIYLWTFPAGKHPVTLSAEPHLFLTKVAFSPNSRIIAAAGNGGQTGGEVVLWNLSKRKNPVQTENTGENIGGVAFSPDSRILAAGDGTGTIYLWRVG